MTRPQPNEAAPYYSNYINLVPEGDIVQILEQQLDDTTAFLAEISEATSLVRYAPDKWTLRELLNHVNDTERVFVFRAMWFARGFNEPLPSFDQEIGVNGAGANEVSWATQVEEFRHIRKATIALFRSLPEQAWQRSGIASDNSVTVRALAYITAGHVSHHANVIRDRYLSAVAD
ncbi:MAG TPA: DinB family protein [Pyrinomonadaceae bacterium]|nr:DinB family protein [Pyrinomonadaceae bacterium]